LSIPILHFVHFEQKLNNPNEGTMIRKCIFIVIIVTILQASSYGPSAPEVAKFEPAGLPDDLYGGMIE
jgi:hypothetical protein